MTPSAIIEKAEEVLKKNSIVAPLVNVFDIAENEGIAIEYGIFPKGNSDVSGFLVADEKVIYLNVDNSAERQAYTVAHELGHYFLNHKPDDYGVLRRPNDYLSEGKSREEKEADHFAANLLMPEKMLRDEIKHYPFLKDSIQLLAAKFGVSSSAMKYRLSNLGIISK